MALRTFLLNKCPQNLWKNYYIKSHILSAIKNNTFGAPIEYRTPSVSAPSPSSVSTPYRLVRPPSVRIA